MRTTSASIKQPNYEQKPFFLSMFCSPIAIGSTFIFISPSNRNRKNKHLEVGQIINAQTVADHDHEVTVNVYIPFEDWPPNATLYPIKEGLGKNLHEVVLSSKTSIFLFDRDVYDIAFVFTPFKLFKRGAILQGINNVFVSHYYDDAEVVKDGELVPFPSMINVVTTLVFRTDCRLLFWRFLL
jgi:hypothetical protein